MPIETIKLGQVLSDPATMREQFNKLAPNSTFQSFHDFLELAIVEADSPFIFNAGSDNLAIDPAINVQEGGVLRATAGDGDGSAAADGSQVCLVVPVQVNNGGLAFECRINLTDITKCSAFVGFTDVTTLEEPISVSGTTITTNATNAVGFVFDTAMTTKEWWSVGVSGNTDDTGSNTTGVAPVNTVYQVLRCEVNSTGTQGVFSIDGVVVKTLSVGVAAASTNLFFTVFINGDGSNSAAATADIDYMLVEHNR